MSDVFDEIEAPATSDVFDEITPEKKDVFDEISVAPSKTEKPITLAEALQQPTPIPPPEFGPASTDISSLLTRPSEQQLTRNLQEEVAKAQMARDPLQLAKARQEERFRAAGLEPPKTPEEVLAEKVKKAMMTKEEMQTLGLPGWMAPIERGVAETAGGLAQPENVAWAMAGGLPGVGGIMGGAFMGQLATGAAGELVGGALDIAKGDTEQGLQRIASGATQAGVVAAPALVRGKGKASEVVEKAPEVPPVIEPVRTQESIAKELGGVAQEPFGNFDRYEFPPDEPGKPRAQVAVPKGSPIEVVREKLQAARDRFKEEPSTPSETRTLTPALLVNGKPVTGPGEHMDIFKAEVAKGEQPIDALFEAQSNDALHVFVNEKGQPLSRTEAEPVFKDITGKDVSDPSKGLQSSDLIKAGLQRPSPEVPISTSTGLTPSAEINKIEKYGIKPTTGRPELQRPVMPELQSPEDFMANEIQKLAITGPEDLARYNPKGIAFDLSSWTDSSKREAEGIRDIFAYVPEGSDKFIVEFPSGTRQADAVSSLVEAIKRGDGPGSGWLPISQSDAIRDAFKRGRPVLAESADTHEIRPPMGYVKEGRIYRRMDHPKKGTRTPQVETKTGIATPTPTAPTPVEPSPAPVAQEPSPKPPTERLLIKPRTDGLVSLEDTKGNRISTHKTVEEAAKTASDLGYGIAPGSPLKPKKTATPTIVGLGAAEKGEAAPGTQIEQLTQALKGVQEKRAPLVEQVKDAFSVGDRLSAAKDTVGKALSGMKAAGDMIISKWKGIPKIDDLLRAKKTLSRAIESRGWRLLKWEQQARKSVPNPRDQAAIAKWIDAGGDRATLEKGLAEAPDKFKRAYQDALNLSGDKLTTAQNVQNYFEARLQEAIDAGVLDHGIDNYIHRMYESKPDILKRAIAYTQTGLLKTNPALAKKRFFQFDWEAEKAGYIPVQSFVKRITAYEASISKAIAAREFIKSASEMKASDGRPVIDIKGVGIPIEDPAGVYREATLIKPKFNPARNNEPTLPNGNPNPNYRGDYVNRDYRALSRWKWVGSDAGGKPIYVQGDVAIHPEYAARVDKLLKPSQVRYGPYGHILRPALAVSSTIKQTMLDLSGFHPVQIAVHGMEHRVMPWKVIKDIDLSHPDVEGLLQGGVTLGGDYSGIHREGLIGASLTRKIPGLGPVMESYHQWLFQSFIPRIKMTMALHALERNRARYAGRMTEEQIFHKTSSEANAAFGELNYTVLERSKTAQDIARLILLAPDFLEARGRFAGQAFQRGGKAFGHEQRTALLLGALTMWTTARIANKLIDGQYHNEPENLFNIVKDGHAYGLRTVQGDLLHLLTKPMQFWMSRLNPVYARTLLEALTGRDYFGRKRSPAEQAWDAASTTIPISLRSNRERKLWESMLNGIGVTARRYSDVDDAFTLAKAWKDKNSVPERGEFIYDPNKDILRPLKLALNHGDEVTAAKEIKALIDSKVYNLKKLDEYFKRFASMPFTGSKENDSKFIKSLTEDQRKTVEAARQHKNEIRKLYMKSRGQYLAPPSQL